MKAATRPALAALLALALPSVAEAASAKRPGRFKLGPFYLTPRLLLKNAGVDSNVFLSRTEQVPDTSIVVSPELEAVLPVGRRLRLSGSGSLDLNYFRRRSSERSSDASGEGALELTLGRLLLFGGAGGASSRQRFSIEFDERIARRERWTEAGLRQGLSSRLSLGLSGRSQVWEYRSFDLGGGQDLREILDRNSLTGSLEARYALTHKTTLVASAQLIEDRFLRPTRSGSQRARSYRYLGGFELGERALIRGKLLAGFREFPQTSAAGVPAYRGPVLLVSADLPLFRIALLRASAERDISYSVTPTGSREERLRNTVVSSRYRGELLAELPFDLLASGYAEYLEARGVFPVRLGPALVRNVDHVWTVGGSLLRRFREGVFLGGTLAWSRRTGTLPGAGYDRLVYGLQAQVTP